MLVMTDANNYASTIYHRRHQSLPVYTKPCKFCYRLQYRLVFKNLLGSAGPV